MTADQCGVLYEVPGPEVDAWERAYFCQKPKGHDGQCGPLAPLASKDVAYERAVNRIGELMAADPAEGTRDGNELSILAGIVDAYEKLRWPLTSPLRIGVYCEESGGWPVYRGESHVATFSDEADARAYVRPAPETKALPELKYHISSEGWMVCDHCTEEVVEARKCMGCGATTISRPIEDVPWDASVRRAVKANETQRIPGVVPGSELERQINLARKDMDQWPEWLRSTAGLPQKTGERIAGPEATLEDVMRIVGELAVADVTEMQPNNSPVSHMELFNAVNHHAREIARLTEIVPAVCSPLPRAGD